MYNRKYDKKFVLLTVECDGYGYYDRQPSGSVTVEIKNGMGRVITYLQNLNPQISDNLRIFLMGEKNGKIIAVDMGRINLMSNGKGDLKSSFNPENVGNTGLSIEAFKVVAIIDKNVFSVMSPLAGYINGYISWKKGYEEFILGKNDNKRVLNDSFEEKNIKASESKFVGVERASESKFVGAERASESKFVGAERASESKFVDVERIPESKFVGAERASESKFAGVERAPESKFADVERAPESKFADVERASESKFVDVERVSESKFAGAEKASESKFVDVERASESKFVDVERVSESKFAGAEKASESKFVDAERASESKFVDAEGADSKYVEKEKETSVKEAEGKDKTNYIDDMDSIPYHKEIYSQYKKMKDEGINNTFKDIVGKFNNEMEKIEKTGVFTKEEIKKILDPIGTMSDLDYIFKYNISLMPFGNKNNFKWVKISSAELALLPFFNVKLIHHPLIACCYNKYRHLILGRSNDANNMGYILGIPDMYDDEYILKASRIGFKSFKVCCGKNEQEKLPENGDYGYWITEVL